MLVAGFYVLLLTYFSIFSDNSVKSLSDKLAAFSVLMLEDSGSSKEFTGESLLAFLLELRSGILLKA